MPTEEEVIIERLAKTVEDYVANTANDFGDTRQEAIDGLTTYAQQRVEELRSQLLKNMFGHLKTKDLKRVLKVITPVEVKVVAEEKRGRGRPRKGSEQGAPQS